MVGRKLPDRRSFSGLELCIQDLGFTWEAVDDQNERDEQLQTEFERILSLVMNEQEGC